MSALVRGPAGRAVVLVLLVLAVLGCGRDERSVRGIVIEVQGTDPATVTAFALRTDEGERLDFSVGQLDLGGGAFPAAHLREHMVSASPIEVHFRFEAGQRIAYRLVDAP
ncbi:MAG TPA: hypothetical protein VFK38_04200 [Candidatus Limnocylindrales bacterium]|nr:hypothetical protein [Candidatus Limnocylindrales bacterium]